MGTRKFYKPWVKLHIRTLYNADIGELPDSSKWKFIECLLLAGEERNRALEEGHEQEDGFLPPLKHMAFTLRTTQAALSDDLSRLAMAGLLELRACPSDEDRWFVTNFAKWQEGTGAAERQRFSRAKRKNVQEEKEEEERERVRVISERQVSQDRHEIVTDDLPTDLPSDFLENPPEHLTPAQIAAVVSERQNSEDPYVIIENYINARITGSPPGKDYDRDWRMPILQMLALVDNDIDLAKQLIDASIIEAGKPKPSDGEPYKLLRAHGLLKFYRTQLERQRIASSTAEDDTLWQRAIQAITRREYSDERLKAAIRAIGGSDRIAKATAKDTDQLKRNLGYEYRRISAPA